MLRLPPERNQWFRDIDGVLTRQKLEDEVLTEIVDFTDQLDSGETVSTAAWDDVSGPTITGTTVTTPQVAFTVTKSGDATLVITTSAARTLRRELRWLARDVTDLSDYR